MKGDRMKWIPMEESRPDPDTTCAVIIRFAPHLSPFVSADIWAMQYEDNVSMGYGWSCNHENDVLFWLALPTPPEIR